MVAMNAYNIWFALFALAGIVVVAPAMAWATGPAVDSLPIHSRFLVSLVPVILILMLGASWLEPGGA